ncbi:MAG: hypothetical protein ACI8VY_001388, partial [Cellvibrionaceae bacterium]
TIAFMLRLGHDASILVLVFAHCFIGLARMINSHLI